MIVTGQEVYDAIVELGFPRVEAPWDESYFKPKVQWLDEFGEWWMREVRPTLTYQPDEFDCDDFSRLARVRATDSILASGIRGATPCFFYCRMRLGLVENPFELEGATSHVTNIVWTEDSSWRWWDAYSGKHADLASALLDESFIPGFVLL